MVAVNDPLLTFPSEATHEGLNAKVAQRSTAGQKRRMKAGKAELPEDLGNLPWYDESVDMFHPAKTSDISTILQAASRYDLTVSVLNAKGTGTHGNATGGDIVIELSGSSFQTIVIDEDNMTVKLGGGVTSRMVDVALTSKDLFTPLVGYTVGVGAFLTGGFGFASRLHGLTADNIVELEVVLADGRVVIANEESHADLFWALRGCGTSFGVVTSLSVRCFPLRKSWSANVIYPFERDTGAGLLKHWRDCVEDVPDELYSNFVIAAGPDAPAGAIAILQICYLGEEDLAKPFLDRMASFTGVKYHFKDSGEITYLRQQELVEAVLKGATIPGNHKPESQVKYLLDGDVLTDLSDEIVEESCQRFHNEAPAGSIWCFELFGGVLANVTNSCIPASHRAGRFHAASILRVPADRPDRWHDDAAGKDWIRETVAKASPGGPLPSFFPNSTTDSTRAKRYHDVIRGSYGHANWSKLKKLKCKYDPMNHFSHALDVGMLGLEEQLVDGV